MAIEKNQKNFFDQYAARHQRKEPVNAFFFELAIAELRRGLICLRGGVTKQSGAALRITW